MRRAAVLILLAALAGCGVRADLKPQAGKNLPVAPYGRDEQLSSAQLLESTPQAAPERSVELRKRSEERADDPFALPPKE
jgi:predicted small lipoprotein YifL